ncbi:MAG: hypothetical protein AUJ98_01155 [Bacteroidetes bacterium CG2_30_33_31]|nr:MAG: hypothetical protein AUJ98_01155 [Bacteroidetes bacterium CG2_30_33_31]
MGKLLRKFNRATHRDLGYFFVGMTLIYSISGIAINHLDDWDPNYIVNYWEVPMKITPNQENFSNKDAKTLMKEWKVEGRYRKFYWPDDEHVKIFFKGGTAVIDTKENIAGIETLNRRPFFHLVNWMHYNPNWYWTWFSDIFAVALIILAISGMFILKGRTGMIWRGTILVSIGLLLPIIYMILFYF